MHDLATQLVEEDGEGSEEQAGVGASAGGAPQVSLHQAPMTGGGGGGGGGAPPWHGRRSRHEPARQEGCLLQEDEEKEESLFKEKVMLTETVAMSNLLAVERDLARLDNETDVLKEVLRQRVHIQRGRERK